jgi:hypothetical protein
MVARRPTPIKDGKEKTVRKTAVILKPPPPARSNVASLHPSPATSVASGISSAEFATLLAASSDSKHPALMPHSATHSLKNSYTTKPPIPDDLLAKLGMVKTAATQDVKKSGDRGSTLRAVILIDGDEHSG